LIGQDKTKPESVKIQNPFAKIQTSLGDIYVELYKDAAPKTVANFLDLAEGRKEFKDVKTGKMIKGKFFDGLIFHRVIPKFMIQGGDPMGNGGGGPGYSFEDEINGIALGLKDKPVDQRLGKSYVQKETFAELSIKSKADYERVGAAKVKEVWDKKVTEFKSIKSLFELNVKMGYKYNDKLKFNNLVKGSLAMANSGPNTNGSQFFINVADTPFLDGKHTNFGKVVKGMEIAIKISEAPVAPALPQQRKTDKPLTEIKIISIRSISSDEMKKLLAK